MNYGLCTSACYVWLRLVSSLFGSKIFKCHRDYRILTDSNATYHTSIAIGKSIHFTIHKRSMSIKLEITNDEVFQSLKRIAHSLGVLSVAGCCWTCVVVEQCDWCLYRAWDEWNEIRPDHDRSTDVVMKFTLKRMCWINITQWTDTETPTLNKQVS